MGQPKLNYEMSVCSDPLKRADVLTQVSSYLGDRTGRGRQGKSTPHPCWTTKWTQTDKTHPNRTKSWELLVLAPLIHSSEQKSFFTESGFRWTTQKMTTYSCRIGLVNPSHVSFTVWRKLNSFEIISCFMKKTFNTCIELWIALLLLG